MTPSSSSRNNDLAAPTQPVKRIFFDFSVVRLVETVATLPETARAAVSRLRDDKGTLRVDLRAPLPEHVQEQIRVIWERVGNEPRSAVVFDMVPASPDEKAP